MKWWKLSGQILLLFCFAWTGEWIAKQAHLPVPGSIIGIFLLLISLKFNIVKKNGYKTVQTFIKRTYFIFHPFCSRCHSLQRYIITIWNRSHFNYRD